nr:TetR/AcrR family transcriptional regulator [Mycobacterium xenopi]
MPVASGHASDQAATVPEDRRAELLALGAEVFGQRPYDEVRIDEVAERAGVSRALMYHYFPDKRAFFAAVVKYEAERLLEATANPPNAGTTLFERVRAGVLAYVDYHQRHPHAAWAVYVRAGRYDPVLGQIDDEAKKRQMERVMAAAKALVPGGLEEGLDPDVERNLRATVYGWLSFTFEMCRQRIMDPSLDAGYLGDTCAHALLDAIGRVPGIPPELADAVAADKRSTTLTPEMPG